MRTVSVPEPHQAGSGGPGADVAAAEVAAARLAVVLTAWRRPEYLDRVLRTWACAIGVQNLRSFTVALEPSPRCQEQLAVIAAVNAEFGLSIEPVVNQRRLGVLVNPVVAGGRQLRADPGIEFLVMAEEDVLVSDDVLCFMSWTSRRLAGLRRVLCACADSRAAAGADPAEVVLGRTFCSLVWGTWRDRWLEVIEPTWDGDYSRGGWDLNLRNHVLAERRMLAAWPAASRSRHIGETQGVHATWWNFGDWYAPTFAEHRGVTAYRLAGLP
jgi:hypothetical protein